MLLKDFVLCLRVRSSSAAASSTSEETSAQFSSAPGPSRSPLPASTDSSLPPSSGPSEAYVFLLSSLFSFDFKLIFTFFKIKIRNYFIKPLGEIKSLIFTLLIHVLVDKLEKEKRLKANVNVNVVSLSVGKLVDIGQGQRTHTHTQSYFVGQVF